MKKLSGQVNPMVIIAVIVGVIILAGLLVASTRNNETTTPANTTLQTDITTPTPEESAPTETPTPTTEPTPPPAAATARTITIQARNYSFNPAEIRVKKGEKIKLVMTASGMEHDLVIDELDIKIPETQPGQTNSIEFTANTAGQFEYYCSISNHRALGMKGTLIVE